MTDQEALKAAIERSSGLEYLNALDAYSSGWHAAIAYLRSQQELKVANKEKLDQWIQERILLGHSVEALKGEPPYGAVYGDGTAITNPVNVAWEDTTTGEVFEIEYLAPQPAIPDGWKRALAD